MYAKKLSLVLACALGAAGCDNDPSRPPEEVLLTGSMISPQTVETLRFTVEFAGYTNGVRDMTPASYRNLTVCGKQLVDYGFRWEAEVTGEATCDVSVEFTPAGASQSKTLTGRVTVRFPMIRFRLFPYTNAGVGVVTQLLGGSSNAAGVRDSSFVGTSTNLNWRQTAGCVNTSDRVLLWARDGDGYLPTEASVRCDSLSANTPFLFVPQQWQIQEGEFRGQVSAVDMIGAYKPASDGGSLFGSTNMTWPGVTKGLSIPMAIDTLGSNLGVTVENVAGFEALLAHFQAKLGPNWVRRGTAAEARGGGIAIVVNDTAAVSCSGRIACAEIWTGATQNIGAARIIVRARALLSPGGLPTLAHEGTHTLGLNHTCAFKSSQGSYGCPSSFEGVTAGDVRYLELLYAGADVMRLQSIRPEHAFRAARDGQLRFGPASTAAIRLASAVAPSLQGSDMIIHTTATRPW